MAVHKTRSGQNCTTLSGGRLGSNAEEGRGKLRNASGNRMQMLIRRCLN